MSNKPFQTFTLQELLDEGVITEADITKFRKRRDRQLMGEQSRSQHRHRSRYGTGTGPTGLPVRGFRFRS